jgi:hypothetical protein
VRKRDARAHTGLAQPATARQDGLRRWLGGYLRGQEYGRGTHDEVSTDAKVLISDAKQISEVIDAEDNSQLMDDGKILCTVRQRAVSASNTSFSCLRAAFKLNAADSMTSLRLASFRSCVQEVYKQWKKCSWFRIDSIGAVPAFLCLSLNVTSCSTIHLHISLKQLQHICFHYTRWQKFTCISAFAISS